MAARRTHHRKLETGPQSGRLSAQKPIAQLPQRIAVRSRSQPQIDLGSSQRAEHVDDEIAAFYFIVDAPPIAVGAQEPVIIVGVVELRQRPLVAVRLHEAEYLDWRKSV